MISPGADASDGAGAPDLSDSSFAGLLHDRAATLLAVDFDGSLAEIVDDPDAARPRPEVLPLLARLVGRFGRVAVVSGRPVAFLASRLAVPGLALEGQYGIEHHDGSGIVVDPAAAPYAAAVATAASRAEAELTDVLVERKGTVAVTLHWRQVPAAGAVAEDWAHQVAGELGLVEYPTRMAVELRPPLPVDKGVALARLLPGVRAACFAGDDHGDLAAFRALVAAREAGTLDHVVRVAVRSSESPRELLAEADVVVDGPAGLVAWLTALSGRD